ncbi:Uncharacterised protein [uncultured archaeon]|nr:Uncharacterised protein [uncultured archaeon]
MIKRINPYYAEVNKNMCSVGDTFGTIELPGLESKYYKCSDCNNEFKGVGKKITCPSCHSKNLSQMFKEE